MGENRRLLILADPITGHSRFSQMYTEAKTLVFHESGRYLSRAQTALQELRREAEWICLAGSGAAAWIALALAAQLPVERAAIWMDGKPCLNRELHRIQTFARRNLSLLISEILLVDGTAGDYRRLAGGLGRHAGLKCVNGAALRREDLLGSWTEG